jgi:hypothetical protein
MSGQPDSAPLHRLEAVFKHRAVFFVQYVSPNFNNVIGRNTNDILVEGSMMYLA